MAYMFFVFSIDPTPPTTGAALLDWVIAEFKSGNLSFAVAGVLMLLVWAATHVPWLDAKIPVKFRGWVAIIAGILSAVATNVLAHIDWGTAILHGLTTGGSAIAFWELVGQHVLPLNASDAAKVVVDTSKAGDTGSAVVVGKVDPAPKNDTTVA
jgi:hypothetical protein